MDWGSIIGAGVSAAGSLLGESLSSKDAQKLARAQMNLQFQQQKELYQNRYQWSTEDAMKAGLNPILTASQGPGSAGQVSALPVEAPHYGDALARGISSAIGILNAEQDLANKEKTGELIDQQRHTQIDLGNMYRTQAGINESNRYWMEKKNMWWGDHPERFDTYMSNEALPSLGGFSGAGALFDAIMRFIK